MMNPLKAAPAILMAYLFLICLSGSLIATVAAESATITVELTSVSSNPRATCTGNSPAGRKPLGNKIYSAEDRTLSISWTLAQKMTLITCEIVDTFAPRRDKKATITIFNSRGNVRHFNVKLRAGEGIFDGTTKIYNAW